MQIAKETTIRKQMFVVMFENCEIPGKNDDSINKLNFFGIHPTKRKEIPSYLEELVT